MSNFNESVILNKVKELMRDWVICGKINPKQMVRKQPTIKMEFEVNGEKFVVFLNDFKLKKGYFDWNVQYAGTIG